jgi:2-phosphoglycerate kinase
MAKTVVIQGPDGDSAPFLKGILVRSLVSINIPFDDAYELSQAIRDELKNKSEITSVELEKQVASALATRFGKQTETEYLARQRTRSEILVHTRTRSAPFSVGILSHSLEACSISPKFSLIGASKVLASIRKTGHNEIDHKSLRKLIYRCLREHCSEKVAEKYLAWRRFHSSGIPLIIMLGGVSGTGKSMIAAELAYRLDITRTLSTDMMRDLIRHYLASQVTPTMQYSSFEAWRGLPPLSHAAQEDDDNRVITGFLAQLASMRPAIETSITRAYQEQENLILEGVHIVPSEIDFCPGNDNALCIQLMLAILDKLSLKQRIREQGKYKHYDSEELIADIWQLQTWLLERADSEDVNIIPNLYVEDSIREILEITSQMILQRFPPELKAIE